MIPDLILLCGGKGTRLRSIVSDVPKPMARVAGVPFLEILLTYYRNLGLRKAILSTGYMASTIHDHFGSHFNGINLSYCVDPEPQGTGGAARLAAQMSDADTVLICNADTYIEFDLERVCNLYSKIQVPIVVARRVPNTERYGRLDIGLNGEVKFIGRGFKGEGHISGGVYLMPSKILIQSQRKAPFSIEDYIFDLDYRFKVYAVEALGRFVDIGVPEDYAAANQMFKVY